MTHTTKLFRFLPVLLLLSGVSLSGSVAVRAEPGQSGGVPDEEILTIVKRHCLTCHAQNPDYEMFQGQSPPGGIVLETLEQIRQLAPLIDDDVFVKKSMPAYGNESGMSEMQRERFSQWIKGLDK